MVCTGRERGVIGVNNMENGRSIHRGGGGEERSFKAPLHNFNLPSVLKWGHQRHLRCIKLPDDSSSHDGFRCRKRMKTAKSPADGGIEAVREEIIFDLKTAADRIKDAIFRKETVYFSSEEEGKEERRWDLRRRGSVGFDEGFSPAPEIVAGVAAGGGGGGGRRVGSGCRNLSPMRKGEKGEEEKRREKKVVVELTRKEMEDDFMEMVGRRLPRRPKKRPRNVQRRLDTLFPGLWLTEVTVDTYKVPDPNINNGKK